MSSKRVKMGSLMRRIGSKLDCAKNAHYKSCCTLWNICKELMQLYKSEKSNKKNQVLRGSWLLDEDLYE